MPFTQREFGTAEVTDIIKMRSLFHRNENLGESQQFILK